MNLLFPGSNKTPLEGIPQGYWLASPGLTRLANALFAGPERVLLRRMYERIGIDRPILIIGAFRSGTTILEQIISRHPEVGHFSYLTSAVRGFPIIGYKIARLAQHLGLFTREGIPFVHNPRIKFTVFSPYECELVWAQTEINQWNPDCSDITLGSDYSDPRFEDYLFSLIRRHLLIQGANRFINKNPVHCTRLGYLHKLFPEARFIFMFRDPLATIISHYRAAKQVEEIVHSNPRLRRIFDDELRMTMLNYRLKTRNYAKTLELDRIHPLLGIANQWADLNAAVLESIRKLGLGSNILRLQYQLLTIEPEYELERIWRFIELQDDHADSITREYAPKLGSPFPEANTEEELEYLPQIGEIIAPVAIELGFPAFLYE
jgi:hypothetical protein